MGRESRQSNPACRFQCPKSVAIPGECTANGGYIANVDLEESLTWTLMLLPYIGTSIKAQTSFPRAQLDILFARRFNSLAYIHLFTKLGKLERAIDWLLTSESTPP